MGTTVIFILFLIAILFFAAVATCNYVFKKKEQPDFYDPEDDMYM